MYYIDCENDISQAIGFPDGRYILYCEIVHNYYKTDMSDDEYCYYRVYDIETGTIVTIYAGYRQWFDLDWQWPFSAEVLFRRSRENLLTNHMFLQ